MKVLIVEDEKGMGELLKKGLEEENHSVTLALDGPEALEFAELYDLDIIVLDLMLPGLDGFEVTRRLRKNGNETPILMLTARDSTSDVVKGLDLGADDYLTKPFSFEVFLARLRAIARRPSASRSACLEVADLRLDPAAHRVFRGKAEIHLSPTEFRLLEFLMRRTGRVISRNSIIEAVWGVDQAVEENSLDAFVHLLRSKVDQPYRHKLIHTVRGLGYTICDNSKP